MTETGKSESCCGGPDAVKQTASASESGCCAPSPEARETKDASVCCGPRIESTPASGARAEKRRLDIDLLYLDLSTCERCQDTESILEEAIGEIARVLETTGVEVALNKIHVTSEDGRIRPRCARPGSPSAAPSRTPY